MISTSIEPIPFHHSMEPLPIVYLDQLSELMEQKPHYLRQKNEMKFLKQKFQLLTRRLATLKLQHPKAKSPWQLEAEAERIKLQRSQQENNALKEAIFQQETLARDIMQLIEKPQLDLVCWKFDQLPIASDQRQWAMNQIISREFERLPSLTSACYSQVHRDVGLQVEIQQSHSFLGTTFELVSKRLWNFFSGNITKMMESDTELFSLKQLEQVDVNLSYLAMQIKHKAYSFLPLKEGTAIVKRFFQDKQQFILWHSILDDPLHPRSPGAEKLQDTFCFRIKAVPNGVELTTLYKIRPPAIPALFETMVVDNILYNTTMLNELIEKLINNA